ncbi:MAG: hypothetical protein OXI83_04820, partial [Gemmatimonadota bacterium]|nr:hypothetical protein [Gemmatimonadota bacterium]
GTPVSRPARAALRAAHGVTPIHPHDAYGWKTSLASPFREPPADQRYRPDLLLLAGVIDRTSLRRPPLSTGPPAADRRYRPDLLLL